MGASFVLKNAEGRAVGYLLQGMNHIRCRVQGQSKRMEAALFYEDGTCWRREMENPSQEHEWPDGGKRICGAVIVSGGNIMADSGEAARRQFERAKARERAAEEREIRDTREKTPAQTDDKAQEARPAAETEMDAAGGSEEGRRWPERRWPPPPCMPHAVYREGQWK